MADDHSEIVTFAKHVDIAIVEIEPHAHIRMLGHEGDDCGCHLLDAEEPGRADAQPAAQRGLQFARDTRRVVDLGENARAALIERLAHLGQRHAPRRAVEQPDTEPALERLDMLADDGRR